MHAARHRAPRELGAFARQMADHLSSLAERVPEGFAKPLRAGGGGAEPVPGGGRPRGSARDPEVGPAPLAAGRFARARPFVPDGALEVNQALRFALLDAE